MSIICTRAYSQVSTPTPRSLVMNTGVGLRTAPGLWKIHTARPKNRLIASRIARTRVSRSGVSQLFRLAISSVDGPNPAIGGTMLVIGRTQDQGLRTDCVGRSAGVGQRP